MIKTLLNVDPSIPKRVAAKAKLYPVPMTETSIVELIFTFVFCRNFEFESMGLNGNGIVINEFFVEFGYELELAEVEDVTVVLVAALFMAAGFLILIEIANGGLFKVIIEPG